MHQVHDESHQQAAVTGVFVCYQVHQLYSVKHGGGRFTPCLREFMGGGHQLIHGLGGFGFGHTNNGGQQLFGGKVRSVSQPGRVECSGKIFELLGGSHTGEHPHVGEGDHGLGFGVAVFVVAVWCI